MARLLTPELLACRSLSIVGMEKNTGKTVCLNHLLSELGSTDKVVAITSIGLDGESLDQVTKTKKPEITLREGTFFVTTEYHYRERRLLSEICHLSEERTSMGRLVTARVLQRGQVIVAGPASTVRVRALIERMAELGADLTIVDGALSRKSPASPAITDGLILTTGAAIAPDLKTIVAKTNAVYRLMQIEEYETPHREALMRTESGIFALEDGEMIPLPIASSLLLEKCKGELFAHGHTLFVSGIVSNSMLDFLRVQPNVSEIGLIVKDFTKIFATPLALQGFLQKGGRIYVLKRPKLLAMCVNPTSPTGFKVPSEVLRAQLQEMVHVPVIDVMAE